MELYNIEAEQSILGAILIEPKSISEGNDGRNSVHGS